MSKKQAVIIIHGIGEQRPMDTLRRFVKAVWETNKSLELDGRPNKTYSRPDNISGNLELRRLTTSKNSNEIRTDFFEFYWAHMMAGNKLSHIWTWLKKLLFIAPWKLPKPFDKISYLFFSVLILVAVIAVCLFLLSQNYDLPLIKWGASVLSLLLLHFIVSTLEDYVGDAARYLDSTPKNVRRRQEIRTSGIKILKDIHDSKEYDRIILVGHSLGSVIAYDILIHAWPTYQSKIPKGTRLPKMNEVIDFLNKPQEPFKVDTYRNLQVEALKEQIEKGNDWLVSDLITLGSPLTYADVLLAANKEELKLKMEQKEFPCCPPKLDRNTLIYLNKKTKMRQLHEDALFAVTKWTNIYFPTRKIIYGDIISGPLAPLFGKGVNDVPTSTSINKGRLSHTYYWKMDKDLSHIEVLRKALDLTLKLSPEEEES